MTVAQPPQSMSASETHVNVSCYGGANGSINLTVTGPGFPFTYFWNNGETTQDIDSLVAGIYNVTITDDDGCTLTQSINISQPVSGMNVQSIISHVDCYGAQTGSIAITVTGQTPPFQYSWSNGSGAATLNNIIAGNYILTVIDNNGCQQIDTIEVLQPLAPLSIQLDPTNVPCYNQISGEIDLLVSGGTPSYTYAWSNGSSSQDLLGVGTGLYSVVVTDANGCSASGSTFLTQPTMALTASAAISGVSCYGGNDGLIDVSVVGGVAPYDFLWNTGSFDEDIDTLTAGTYVLEIYDDNGCYLQQTYQVTQSLSPLVLSSVMTPVGCYGGTNGSLNLSVVGGTAPYVYSWSNGSTSQDLQDIAAGIYSVIVTDVNGCSATLQDTVTEPGVYALSAQLTPVACFASSTGSIDLTVIGGTAPYVYNWNNGASTQDLQNLLAGTYSVVVTDQQGCQVSGSYVVNQPSAVLTLNAVIANVSCSGTTTATIDLTVTGGAAPYTYAWSNQAITEDLASVGVGTYSVTVTDAGGCVGTTSITVTQPAPLSIILTPTNPLCPNTATGSVDLTVSGGTSPYTYQWSGPNGYTATSQDIGFIPIGLYYVIVTDAYGCSASQTTSLSNPIAISATYTSTPVQCYGGSNGTVDVTVTGGTAPYTYNWSNGAITQDIQNRPAGNDTLIITDFLGCQYEFITLVTQPTAPLTINANISNIGCFGSQSGNIDITMTGGTPNYTFQWNNSLTTEDLVNVNPGLYSVLVYDANGCFTTDTFQITQVGSPMTLQITGSNVVCYGDNNGSIDLTVNGGTSPYLYNWSNGATTQDLSGLLAGTYTIDVTDANQCIVSTSLTITSAAAPLIITAQEIDLQCFNQNTGAIDVTITGGQQPYSYAWTSTTGFTANTEDITNLAAGGYTLVVTDFNGCTATQTFLLTQPATQAVITSTVNDILCYGATTGWINASVVGGALPYSYLWLGPTGGFVSSTEDLFGIGAGWYELFVTDAAGCTTSDSILVSTPAQITSAAQVTNVSCFGFGNGSIDVTTTGGVQPYSFMWSTGAPSEDLSGLNPGSYTLTVTDSNNCVVSTTYTVTQPAGPLTLNIAQVNVSCYSDSTGFIDLIPSGGTFPYSYDWSGPNGYTATTEDILNLPIGTYGVVVTDANGCLESAQTTITQPSAPLTLSELHTNVSCYGGSNGEIAILAQGGTPSYAYLWNNGQTSAVATNLTVGSYTVLVSDSLGCSASMSVTLTQPQAPLSSSSVVTDLVCMNDAEGVIDLSVSGGTPGYTYSWSTGATTQDIDSLESGSYVVTITDTLGCELNDTIVVNNPPNPMVVTPSQTNVTCYNYTDGLLTLAISGGLPAYDIQWSTGDTIAVLDSLIAGTYSVIVTDAQGCDELLSFEITQPQPIVAYFNPSVTFGCVPLSVTFTNNSSGPYTNSLWTFGNAVTSTAQNATTVLPSPGCYDISLIVYNAAGCADTLTMDSLVCVVPGPQASFTSTTGTIDYFTGQLELNNNSLGAISNNFWTFGDGSPNSVLESPIHYFPDQTPGSYLVTLTVTDTNGCVDTASAVFTLIELLNVYVPNSITIDGDGINDVFLPVFSNVDIIERYELQIFNRWGAMVWETDTPAEGWNGRYKDNKDVQLGLYNWKITYTDNKQVTRTIAGHVNVLR
jgi:gliding motility-associated-like protein